MQNVALAEGCRVTIAMSTDAGTPGNRHSDNAQELVSIVWGAGLTFHEAVTAATLSGTRPLGQEDNQGSLEAGKYADAIGFTHDQLQDIDAIRDVRRVIKGGDVARNDLAG